MILLHSIDLILVVVSSLVVVENIYAQNFNIFKQLCNIL